ncbi:MAG: hypothetical protein KatS3mg125_0381 [Lysobacterales bacterium]|jgi:putative heme degradation protein|nr:MAG: hypothetical protein KatS3mg125_0381 [Xanthomonadales bacterium]
MIALSESAPINAEWLRQRYAKLREEHEHLHLPQAAAMLKVPEEALIASRLDGFGAVRLRPEPEAVLAALTELGKLLIAVLHPAGVLIGIAPSLSLARESRLLCLEGPNLALRVDPHAVHRLYLLHEEHGPHGRERHVLAYDRLGERLWTVLVLYKRHAADFARLGERFRDPDQGWHGEFASEPPEAIPALPEEADDCSLEALKEGVSALAAGLMCVEARRGGVELRVQAERPRLRAEPEGYLHLDHAELKLHSALARYRRCWRLGRSYIVRDEGGTRELLFAPGRTRP